MANEQILPAAEFQSLPLEFIISAPLAGVVKAQAIAAEQTRQFMEAFKNDQISFHARSASNGTSTVNKVEVPLLSMVPVPHLRIDSLTLSFKYEISQIVGTKAAFEKGVELEAGSAGVLSNFIKATLKGAVTSNSSSESTLNRSGSLQITVHASEAPIPEGLARILSLLAHTVPDPQPQPQPQPPTPPAPAPGPVA